jgi:hypothetical protein
MNALALSLYICLNYRRLVNKAYLSNHVIETI